MTFLHATDSGVQFLMLCALKHSLPACLSVTHWHSSLLVYSLLKGRQYLTDGDLFLYLLIFKLTCYSLVTLSNITASIFTALQIYIQKQIYIQPLVSIL